MRLAMSFYILLQLISFSIFGIKIWFLQIFQFHLEKARAETNLWTKIQQLRNTPSPTLLVNLICNELAPLLPNLGGCKQFKFRMGINFDANDAEMHAQFISSMLRLHLIQRSSHVTLSLSNYFYDDWLHSRYFGSLFKHVCEL